MSKTLLTEFYTCNLPEIVEKLDKDYYKIVEKYCGHIESIASLVRNEEREHASIALYISLCLKLTEKIRNHVQMRKLVTIPYVHELQEKVSTSHDCSTCENGCQIGHSMKVSGIKESNQHIKEIFYRLQMIAAPLYTEDTYSEVYKDLRNEIMSIDTKLTELFYLEEAVLLPKVIEAQRKIHVRN